MTSFGRTKVKKTSKSIQVYRIRESPFSKGLQGYTRVSLAIKKIPTMKSIGGVKDENGVSSKPSEEVKAEPEKIDFSNAAWD